MSDAPDDEPATKKRDPTHRGDRSTAAEVAVRVQTVLDMLVQGGTSYSVWRFVSGKMTDPKTGQVKAPPGGPWDVSLRTIERYVAKANVILAAEGSVQRAEAIALARRRYRHIMAKSLAAGEHGVAERCVRSIARLDGLEAPTYVAVHATHDHTGEVTHTHTHAIKPSTMEERAAAMADLFRVAAERRSRGLGPGPVSVS